MLSETGQFILPNHPFFLQQEWNTFFSSFSKLGNEEIANRSQDIMRFLKENGVTYQIYNDQTGLNRAWNLDIVPFIVDANEWRLIEAGLQQRATLFNLILQDIYGQQRLIKDGILPMEIVYNHNGFLRECCGIQQAGHHQLVIYSADMARSKDGRIWILNDRTQAPSGSGYAWENRMAMARIVPELFNGQKVKRLSPFFHSMRQALTQIAPSTAATPRIVILTPGPGNETYFEHSFLSSHLGFTMVQGDDLMVKDNFVWLKTLGGLEKVDVIMRRVDDVYCDPLELKEDSLLGVPGLLQAVRSGNVSIANPLGSSVVENPGLIPFLPAIARYFLNEPLKLPTIASWWCGQPQALNYVLDNLSSLVIKRIFRESDKRTSVDATLLDHAALQELKERIKTQPHLYVGQEKVDFSLSPSWVNGNLESSHALFRSFAVSDNGGYTIMNGGLTRTSLDKENMIISNQLGGFSKDTWILSDEENSVLHIKKDQDHLQDQPTHDKSDYLPSRTGENLFWAGRYAERVLGNARFLRTVMQVVEEANKAFIDNDLDLKKSLLTAVTAYTNTFPGFTGKEARQKMENPWKELADVLFDEKRVGGLSYNISCFLRSLEAIRDHWSGDTWRVIKEMEENWQRAKSVQNKGNYKIQSALDGIITSMMAFVSLNRETISRDRGWVLLDSGRKMEQSILLVGMLRATLTRKNADAVEYLLQEVVLNSNESMVNYRFKYKAHLQLPLVLDLLLFDPNNPRSLLYQVEKMKAYLSALPKIQNGHSLSEHERLVLEVFTKIKLSGKDELSVVDEATQSYKNLDNFLTEINALIYNIYNVVSSTYFKHAQTQQQLFR
ncbi:circularly permuted type 2 ATP-grasp protein [Flavihumibacter profundi]|uniref:circularly permuted type 2 ATP-grasp protein n=1 Tax=Flavihumibacter profundi TaxID=2716883 RepID=UPI001CC7F9FC|nr:circularly permuted type 2 ATP-grasp protein [Flavihumibacter profundi]MBZ5857531.1 circularly permuted type 2 ATP-grasp protein [Flavihumibacter profundi]